MNMFAPVVLLVVFASTASAQQPRDLPPEVQPGVRVRVVSPAAGTVTGRVTAVQGDEFLVARDRLADTVRLSANQLASLDLSVGRHKRRWRGAGLGLLGGAALGAVIGAATYQKPDCSGEAYFCDLGRGFDASFGAVVFGGVGAVTGALVGAGSADDWKPLSLRSRTSLELRMPRSTGRLSVGASLRF